MLSFWGNKLGLHLSQDVFVCLQTLVSIHVRNSLKTYSSVPTCLKSDCLKSANNANTTDFAKHVSSCGLAAPQNSCSRRGVLTSDVPAGFSEANWGEKQWKRRSGFHQQPEIRQKQIPTAPNTETEIFFGWSCFFLGLVFFYLLKWYNWSTRVFFLKTEHHLTKTWIFRCHGDDFRMLSPNRKGYLNPTVPCVEHFETNGTSSQHV